MKTNRLLAIKCVFLMMSITVLTVAVGCEVTNYPKEGDLNNIAFDKIVPTWTQEEVVNKVKLALLQLSTQSQTLRSQYTDWETQLRSEIIGNTDYAKLKQINFAQTIKDIEANLSNVYQWSYVDTIKRYAGEYFIDLAEAICEYIVDQNAEALFLAQAEAYYLAHYINQREYYTSEAEKISKQNEFTVLKARVEQLGGFVIPQNMSGAISTLRFDLGLSIPKDCGEHRNNFIQQYEDYAQFDAWTDDLLLLGYNLSYIPRAVSY